MHQARKSFAICMGMGLFVSLILSGCGGGGDGAGAPAPAPPVELSDAQTAALDTSDTISFVIENGLGLFLETFEETVVDCPLSGEATVGGDATGTETTMTEGSFAFDATLTFTNCDGLDGAIDVVGGGTFDANTIVFDTTLDGTVANACVFDHEQLTFSLSVDIATEATTGTLSGSLFTDCVGETASCTWDNVDLLDEVVLEAGCN